MTARDIVQIHPLISFSVVSHIQFQILLDFGNDTESLLNKCVIHEGEVNGQFLNKTYGQIWFWVIGAYELVRTLHQRNEMFDEESKVKLRELKSELSVLRIPFAKQELRGDKLKLLDRTNVSLVSEIDFITKDFVFNINGKKFRFKKLFDHFQMVFKNIKLI
jgi:hypothetical protein